MQSTIHQPRREEESAAIGCRPGAPSAKPKRLSEEARALAAANLKLAYHLASKTYRRTLHRVPLEDLEDVAIDGLLHAARYYNPAYPSRDREGFIPFAAFAARIISQLLWRYCGEQLKVPPSPPLVPAGNRCPGPRPVSGHV
jgi:hypothetical protein